jgi:Flp pilus assembly protein TadG
VSPRDEDGTALIEVTWLAVLLMVPLVYVVLAVYDVQRHAFAATAAARAAGRAFVLAPDTAQADAQAHEAAAVALGDQRVDPRAVRVDITCRPAGSCLVPGSVVVVDVRTQVRLPLMPSVLGDDAPSIRVDAAHTVPYGSFREDRS